MGKWRWRERHKSAFERARHALGLDTVGQIIIRFMLGGIYVAVVWNAMGPTSGQGQLALKIAAAIAPIILFVVLYGWHFSAHSIDFGALVRRVHLNLAAAIVLTLAAIGAWIWYVHVQTRIPIRWGKGENDFGLVIEGSLRKRGEPADFYVAGFQFAGHNRSENIIYQVEASITLERSGAVFPLYTAVDGQWVLLNQTRGLPPSIRFNIGCQMRDDTIHCGEFTKRVSPEEFLREVGAFEFSITLDGQTWRYPFSLRKLEKDIEARKVELGVLLNRPLFPPGLERKP